MSRHVLPLSLTPLLPQASPAQPPTSPAFGLKVSSLLGECGFKLCLPLLIPPAPPPFFLSDSKRGFLRRVNSRPEGGGMHPTRSPAVALGGTSAHRVGVVALGLRLQNGPRVVLNVSDSVSLLSEASSLLFVGWQSLQTHRKAEEAERIAMFVFYFIWIQLTYFG